MGGESAGVGTLRKRLSAGLVWSWPQVDSPIRAAGNGGVVTFSFDFQASTCSIEPWRMRDREVFWGWTVLRGW